MKFLNNIEHGKVLNIKDLVNYEDNKASLTTLIDDVYSKIVIQALDAGISIPEHNTSGDVMIYVIEGQIKATCDDMEYTLVPEQVIFMKKGTKLLETAVVKSKVLLVVVRGKQEVLIEGVEFLKVSKLKSLVNTTFNDITFTNMNHFAVVLKVIDASQTIERVNGNRDCLIVNLQGEAEIKIDDEAQMIDTDEVLVISTNTFYTFNSVSSMKYLLIYAREKSTKIDY